MFVAISGGVMVLVLLRAALSQTAGGTSSRRRPAYATQCEREVAEAMLRVPPDCWSYSCGGNADGDGGMSLRARTPDGVEVDWGIHCTLGGDNMTVRIDGTAVWGGNTEALKHLFSQVAARTMEAKRRREDEQAIGAHAQRLRQQEDEAERGRAALRKL
jgi:hypothetical protein